MIGYNKIFAYTSHFLSQTERYFWRIFSVVASSRITSNAQNVTAFTSDLCKSSSMATISLFS